MRLLGGFRAGQDGPTARLGAAQAGIIRNLVGQVADLIQPGGLAAPGPDELAPGSAAALAAQVQLTDAAAPPADPALARLLPDAYRDDPQAAAEFRRYTEPGLRSGKLSAARTVLETLPASGGRVRLTPGQAQSWLRALNDVRLALAVRLGVSGEEQLPATGIEPGDPQYAAYADVYQWLAYLQETLVSALAAD